MSVATHERFGTAVVRWEGGQIDLAERRAESYPAPGALPEVRPGSEHEDLARRDFTVNALAVALAGPERGELSQAGDALEDLRAGVLRVLHDRSFIDDPTRLLRLARYGARLGFEPETHTALLARRALDEGALATISRARIGAELRLALSEPQAAAVLAAMGEQGVLAAVAPGLRFDRELADRASSLLPEDGRRDLLLMVTLVLHLTMLGGGGGRADDLRDPRRARVHGGRPRAGPAGRPRRLPARRGDGARGEALAAAGRAGRAHP